mmetsp:Transcript_25508/g.65932  ORF Transcript_25508/g.65932 Transcript_25508/m.65932 type:complete len:370 (-) Transcript_25508:1103-2212(-)
MPRLLIRRRRVLVGELLLLDGTEQVVCGRTRVVGAEAFVAELLGEVELAALDVHVREQQPAQLELRRELGDVVHLGDALEVVARLGCLATNEVANRDGDEGRHVVLVPLEHLKQARDGALHVWLRLVRDEDEALEHLLLLGRPQFAQQLLGRRDVLHLRVVRRDRRGRCRVLHLPVLNPVDERVGRDVDLDHIGHGEFTPLRVLARVVELLERLVRVVEVACEQPSAHVQTDALGRARVRRLRSLHERLRLGEPPRVLEQHDQLVQRDVVRGLAVEQLLEVVDGRVVLRLAQHQVGEQHRRVDVVRVELHEGDALVLALLDLPAQQVQLGERERRLGRLGVLLDRLQVVGERRVVVARVHVELGEVHAD